MNRLTNMIYKYHLNATSFCELVRQYIYQLKKIFSVFLHLEELIQEILKAFTHNSQ